MNEEENKLEKEILQLKYTILRRTICTDCHSGHLTNLHFGREDLEKLCYEIENKSIKQLKEIHKKWIGY